MKILSLSMILWLTLMAGIDAITELTTTKFRRKAPDHRFSFQWLAQRIVNRQLGGKDTIIIITGDRRQGKSNWGLKLIRQYISIRKSLDKNFSWSWKKNFPLNRTQAQEMSRTLPDMNFIFYDEAGDMVYRQDTNKKAQKELIKFMNKSGTKRHLTVMIWPDVFTLDPKILNMAQLLVVVPYRAIDPKGGGSICSFAFIYGRSNNPFNYDKFGIEKIRKKFLSPKMSIQAQLPGMDGKLRIQDKNKIIEVPYPRQLFKFLKTMPTFMKSHRFNAVDKRFEDQYIKHVKDKLLDKKDDEFVSIADFEKITHNYNTLLYNLYTKDGKSIAQIERLHISPVTGSYLRSSSSIRKDIELVKARL